MEGGLKHHADVAWREWREWNSKWDGNEQRMASDKETGNDFDTPWWINEHKHHMNDKQNMLLYILLTVLHWLATLALCVDEWFSSLSY